MNNINSLKIINNYYEMEEVDKDIENSCWENTIEFCPIVKIGKVIKVTDGDTICIATKIPYDKSINKNIVYRFHIRFFGIDTPEMKSKNLEEKNLAHDIQKFLSNILLDKFVSIETKGIDKYGRILGIVYTIDGVNINKLLIDKRYGVVYNGKKKDFAKKLGELY